MEPDKEKEFLMGYFKFTLGLRLKLIKDLGAKSHQTEDLDEVQYCMIMAMEQLFLLYETFEAVFRAFKDRKRVSFMVTMAKDQNPQLIADWLKGKTEDQALKELDYPISKYDAKIQEGIKTRLKGIIAYWKQDRVIEATKTMIIPLFNSLKHKLMVYKKGNEIAFYLNETKEQNMDEFIAKAEVARGENTKGRPNIDWVVEFAEQFQFATQDLIALRLYELGVKPEELL